MVLGAHQLGRDLGSPSEQGTWSNDGSVQGTWYATRTAPGS